MVMISSVPPNGAPSGSLANAAPQAVVQAMGAANSGPTAHQLLQTAVIASSFVPSYAEQPKPPAAKTPSRPQNAAQPSSALAAQFLAQTPEADEEAVAIFNPRPQIEQSAGQEADTVEQWQGGQSQPAPDKLSVPIAPAALQGKTDIFVTSASFSQHAASGAALPADRPQEKQIALQQAIGGKKGGMVLTRGANAYALTDERNTSAFIRAYVEAVM